MPFQIIKTTYSFECTQCGNCCTGDQKVNLNLYDLYNMALYKGFKNTGQLFDAEIVHLVKAQNNVWTPQIKFKSIKKTSGQKLFSKQDLVFCPFLINELDDQNHLKGLCSLHPHKKPLICTMAPVGRILDLKEGKEDFVFVKPAPDCPGVESQKTNRLADLQNDLADELAYEKRFYKLLESLDKTASKSFYLKRIYSFPTILPFEQILKSYEQD
jgi:Fe-S-cluster containining protein